MWTPPIVVVVTTVVDVHLTDVLALATLFERVTRLDHHVDDTVERVVTMAAAYVVWIVHHRLVLLPHRGQ